MTLADLFTDIDVVLSTGDLSATIQSVVADSRLIQPGDVFVAVRGTDIDGHSMIAEAIEAGAAAIVAENVHESVRGIAATKAPSQVPIVIVDNTRSAHAALLRAARPEIQRALDSITFYGVTGTNGKTTIATILFGALRGLGKKPGLIGTTGYRYANTELPATHTTPDVHQLYMLILTMAEAGVDTIVMEVSSHALEQERTAGIKFDAAVFTNLTRDHLDYHGTMQEYGKVKKRLFDNLDSTSRAIVNADDSASKLVVSNCKAPVVRVGVGEEADVRIADVVVGQYGCSFSLNGSPFSTSLLGGFNVSNAALCVVLLLGSGFETAQIQDVVAAARGADGRMEQYQLLSGATAIIDYAHTPDALENVLRTCRPLLARGSKLHVVFGCGGDRDTGKRLPMGEVASTLADVVWVTNDNPRGEEPQAIIEAILEGMVGGSAEVHVEPDRAVAIERALKKGNPGDIVVVAGKGHEQFQIVGTERRPFSDRAEVLAYVKNG